MALGAALVDRARPYKREATTGRVEGRTRTSEVPQAWFKCRLFLPLSPAEKDPQQGRRRSVRRPTLLFGVRDLDGNTLDIGFDVRVEVESNELGTSLWRVVAEPEPLRKRRTVIGWQATLERVEERQSEAVA